MDGVLGDQYMDWEPPTTAELEGSIPGYEKFAFIGRGGMGAVYSSYQISLARRVAIKILSPDLGEDARFLEGFQREARLLARLQHPHIITVHGSGTTITGYLYIVMEHVEDVSLLKYLRVNQSSVTRILDIAAQVCEALEFAHKRGVLHLDIKPGNILIDQHGHVRVADFGLAKEIQETTRRANSDGHTGRVMGTAGYTAPEQRLPGALVDQRADVFSLGVTLYEMFTGRLPVGAFDMPSKKAGTPKVVDKIVLRALREDPDDRYQSAADMRSAIATVMLRLGRPFIQRAIISRPLVSMVTCVIIGMGFIYTLDEVNRLLTAEKAAAQNDSDSRNIDQALPLTLLNDEWALLNMSVTWENLTYWVQQHDGWRLAEIHTPAEMAQVLKLLRERQYTLPLWLGAEISPGQSTEGLRWLSGASMSYQPWMPADQRPPVIITEIQANNAGSFKTADGSTPDWIEIHNPTTRPIDLTGYHLRHFYGGTSGRDYLAQDWLGPHSLPDGLSIILQPGEYRVLICHSGAAKDQGNMHIRFKLEGSVGILSWIGPSGTIWQRFEHPLPAFPDNASIGIAPDRQDWGWCVEPTPGRANSALKSSFPAPLSGRAARARLLMLPEFEGRWTTSASGVPHHALLRRRQP